MLEITQLISKRAIESLTEATKVYIATTIGLCVSVYQCTSDDDSIVKVKSDYIIKATTRDMEDDREHYFIADKDQYISDIVRDVIHNMVDRYTHISNFS